MKKTYASELFFWSHLVFFIGWFVPFSIPLSFWPQRISYHFWYMVFIFAINYAWGVVFFMKGCGYKMSCPWTTYTQWLRGFDITHKKNYTHSFVVELSEHIGIPINIVFVNTIMFLTFFIVLYQYVNI